LDQIFSANGVEGNAIHSLLFSFHCKQSYVGKGGPHLGQCE